MASTILESGCRLAGTTTYYPKTRVVDFLSLKYTITVGYLPNGESLVTVGATPACARELLLLTILRMFFATNFLRERRGFKKRNPQGELLVRVGNAVVCAHESQIPTRMDLLCHGFA